MTDIVLDNVGAGYNRSAINNNFSTLENTINTEVVHSVGGNNIMQQDLDLNSNDLLNVHTIDTQNLTLGGQVIIANDEITTTQTEVQALASGQTAVVFTNSTARGTFYLNGPDVDSGRLVQGTDYTVVHATNTVTLTSSYPAGTQLVMVYFEGDTGILDAASVNYSSAVARTVESKLNDWVSTKDFGAKGDGVTDDTAALTAFFDYLRDKKVKGVGEAATYKISAPLDISGVDFEGVLGGFNNVGGTIFEGDGTHVIFEQQSVTLANITYSIKNVGIKGGTVGLQMRYAVHCVIENLFITECGDGLYCGTAGVLGPLFNTFRNVRAVVTGTALTIQGNDWANANKFDTCYFNGDVAGGSITCSGGIGAVANHFDNTEFAGDRLGLIQSNTKSTVFDNGYFESVGPALVFDGFSVGSALNHCTFGSLRNDNAEGIPAFIWHKSGSCQFSIEGGYIYLATGTQFDNLRLVHSDNPAFLALTMTDLPKQEISSSGWKVFNTGLPTARDRISFSDDYTPAWTTTGTAPDIGNGTVEGRYILSGRMCTVEVKLLAGSTTTFGTGQFQFSLPFAASASSLSAYGAARLGDTGTAFYTGVVEVNTSSNVAVIYSNGTGNLVQSNSPFTWANTDTLRFTVTYEITA